MKTVKSFFIEFLPVLLATICSVYVLCSNNLLFEMPVDSGFHFNVITVNALFGGFLYTNYSLLIGLSDNHIVQELRCTNIIDKRNKHILKGIMYAIVSVIAGLYFVLIPRGDSEVQNVISCFMANIEIIFLLFSIFFFILSLFEMKRLVRGIYHSDKTKKNEEIDDIRNFIRNHDSKKSKQEEQL